MVSRSVGGKLMTGVDMTLLDSHKGGTGDGTVIVAPGTKPDNLDNLRGPSLQALMAVVGGEQGPK